MIEGLYSVIFGTPQGNVGGGVVVFRNGKAQGGDLAYFYDGVVRAGVGDHVEADVLIRKYQEAGESVFGNIPEFRLQLKGQVAGPRFVLDGQIVGNPAARITVQFSKLADA